MQDGAPGVPRLNLRLCHEYVVRPLARIDYAAVAKPETEVKSLTFNHRSSPDLANM
jgi:hypothetical protein